VYNTRNYWVFGLCPSSGIKKQRTQRFRNCACSRPQVISKVSLTVINSKGSSGPNKEEKPLGSVCIPYVMRVSEKFKRTGNQYNILGRSSKLNALLGVHSWKPRPREIRNKRDPMGTGGSFPGGKAVGA
jgi:hypothetical protein